MLIPPFHLPSLLCKEQIQLREATVADMMTVADITPEFEEAATTIFLNAIKQNGPDAAAWTGDDRRFALLWYYVHANDDHSYVVEFVCPECGEHHRFDFDLRCLLDGYSALLSPGYQEIDVAGAKIIVRPHTGRQLEDFEGDRVAISVIDDVRKQAKQKIVLSLKELVSCCSWSDGEKIDDKYGRIEAMSIRDLKKLRDGVVSAMDKMSHGLETGYDEDGRLCMVSPEFECPNGKGGTVRVLTPFRNNDFLPRL